jgi:hypothetical protein
MACLNSGFCGLEHFSTPQGPEACFEQSPTGQYSWLAAVGRRYLVTWVDKNFIRITADFSISVTLMKPEEVIMLQFSHRPPLYPRLPMRANSYQTSVEFWGELPPRAGAWSTAPNIPIYSAAYDDHSGNALIDPCARGTYKTMTYPGSCDKGVRETTGGFAAPQLAADPSIYALMNFTATRVLATGRTENGGLLHPFSGKLRCVSEEASSFCL